MSGNRTEFIRAFQCTSCGQIFRTRKRSINHDCPKRVKKPVKIATGQAARK